MTTLAFQSVGYRRGKRIESPVFDGELAEGKAVAWASEHLQGAKSVQLLMEHDKQLNAGKLFLHRFLKP